MCWNLLAYVHTTGNMEEMYSSYIMVSVTDYFHTAVSIVHIFHTLEINISTRPVSDTQKTYQ